MTPSNREKQIIEMFDSFCKKVAKNCARNCRRTKNNHDKHYTEDPIESLIDYWISDDDYPSDANIIYINDKPYKIHDDALYQAFLNLQKKEQEVLILEFWEDLSYKEIAQQMEVSPRTVYTLRKNAVKVIKKLYEKEHRGRDP